MTKARTKGSRRRKRQVTLAGGNVVPQPATQGRRTDMVQEPPADRVALAARARLTGCTAEDARDILASEDMGRCIRALHDNAEPRRALLTVWQGLCAAWANYCARCLSINPSAQAANLPMLPDPMQTDQGYRIDTRTGDERDEAARRVWFDALERLMTLPADQRAALRGHLQGFAAPLWDADRLRPTRTGVLAVEALAGLHKTRGG
jgi:hypothetical protein